MEPHFQEHVPLDERRKREQRMKRALKTLIGLSLALAAFIAWGLPTLQQVEAEVGRGNYAQAESMMREVVTARPGSAKAHYVYAEILAHNANITQAATEARRARELDPQITFTDPQRFRSFEELLQREQRPKPSASTHPSPTGATPASPLSRTNRSAADDGGVPGWVWGAGAALLALLAWRALARRRTVDAPYPAGAGNAAAGPINAAGPAGYGAPGNIYGQPTHPVAGPGGRGMVGTGLAAAGGFAAGMLADEFLHRRQEPGSDHLGRLGPNEALEPIDDGGAANELQSRPVDFGTGEDWGGDATDTASGDGGGVDFGGSDDNDWT